MCVYSKSSYRARSPVALSQGGVIYKQKQKLVLHEGNALNLQDISGKTHFLILPRQIFKTNRGKKDVF